MYVLIHIFSNGYFGFAKISDSRNLKRQHSQYDLHNCNLCNCNFNYLNRYANLSVIPYSDSNPDIIDQFHRTPLIATCNLRAHIVATNRYRSVARYKRRKFEKEENSTFLL